VKTRLLIAGLFACLSISAAAQVTGEFYLEKSEFARGEPVFLYFKISNQGPGTMQVVAPYLGQPGCSGVLITVTSSSPPPSSCPDFSLNSCTLNNSMGQAIPLPPGHSHVDRFLLNFSYEINNPDDYQITASHAGFPFLTSGDARADLSFRVDGDTSAYPPSKIQLWVDQLKSTNQEKRAEAAMTLASIAPVSLQATLLGFARNPEFSRFAPLAFHRLNTPESLQAMADLVKTAGPGSWEQLEASRYLAETGDQKWYPLLLDAAVKNGKIVGFPIYAAELGGPRMLPVLADLTKNPNTRLPAIRALGSTDAREAVPILLEFLKSPERDIFYGAEYSLRQLTHHTSGQDPQSRGTQTEYENWAQWWQLDSASAPIYKDTECEKAIPLPLAPSWTAFNR
jgi:hypothetical protein